MIRHRLGPKVQLFGLVELGDPMENGGDRGIEARREWPCREREYVVRVRRGKRECGVRLCCG
jgi:hypothetical protein